MQINVTTFSKTFILKLEHGAMNLSLDIKLKMKKIAKKKRKNAQ